MIATVLFTPGALAQRESSKLNKTTSSSEAKPSLSQTYTQGGVSVNFSIQPVSNAASPPGQIVEASEATVKFEITDAISRKHLTNLRPVAWIDSRSTAGLHDVKECREKVQSLLQPNFTRKPDVDLNSYFMLTLNQEPNISVIDPLSGFGSSKLYTLVPLRSPGEDWVLTANQKRLFVSLPAANQIAVVDTTTWQVVANIDAGIQPARLSLQHDERYLWVGNDSAEPRSGGVTVIDTTTLKVSAHLSTGAGHHEIGFTDNDRYAFITNKVDGTLSVVDVRNLTKIRDLQIGSKPTALAFSALSKTLYVANEGDGNIVAVDGVSHTILTRILMQPGLRALRLTSDDRFGFVTNTANDTVSIFDVATNSFLQRVPVAAGPDQIAFTKDFAYIRSTGSEFVTLININRLGQEGSELSLTRFPSGQKAPRESPYSSLASMLVPAPEQGTMLVANTADKMIYFYAEGMAAPMGSFQNYKRDPRALLVLDNSLRETGPGIYSTTIKLPARGNYDVPFLLDSPRLVNCFEMTIGENPTLPKKAPVALKIEPLAIPAIIKVGETYQLHFKVTDTRSNQLAAKLEDLGVLVFLAPGIWQQRMLARQSSNGTYELSINLPEPGVYYVFFQCPSLEVRYTQIPSLTLEATNSASTKQPQ